MKHIIQHIKNRKEKGQSLVEVALFFPIFLIILAGVIEVSHLAITQNRISNAARATARFGSNGGDNEGFSIVALNSVTQTLDLSEETWDLWAIRGKVNDDADGFEEWEFAHVYGISNTKKFNNVSETAVQQQVLDELNLDSGDGNGAGIKFVGSYILHDVDSIIGIDALPGLLGYQSVRGFNVMRILGNNFEQTVGCSAFPIAVHKGIRSVTPPGTTGTSAYPPASLFDYPDNDPTPIPTYAQFFRNVPDTPLEDAQEGYVYKIQNGSGEGNFGWLVWNTGIAADSGTLGGSIGWPGDSLDYSDHGDGGQPAAAAYPWVVRGYVNPYDSTDTALHIGDWVPGSTGTINSTAVRDATEPHVDKDRTLRLIIWGNATAQGNNVLYQVERFGIFKLHGYHISQGQGGSWILAEFIRWDDSCGQQ